MAYSRLSMRKIFEALRLSVVDGRSHREIARAIFASPTTVGAILRRAKLSGLTYPLPAVLPEALLKTQLDHRALFTTQMFVGRSHRNTLPPGKCCTSYLRPPRKECCTNHRCTLRTPFQS